MTNVGNPLIVQSDKTVLLEVENPLYEECRDQLARFAELVKSPEHVHTYRITPLSLWNAAAAGLAADQIVATLERYGKYDLPGNVRVDIRDYVARYGKVKLVKESGELLLRSDDAILITEISRHKRMAPLLRGQVNPFTLLVDPAARGHIKQASWTSDSRPRTWPATSRGRRCPLSLRAMTRGGLPFRAARLPAGGGRRLPRRRRQPGRQRRGRAALRRRQDHRGPGRHGAGAARRR